MSNSAKDNEVGAIPLLDDIIASTEGSDTAQQTPQVKPVSSKNPFLPHENLAKLAHERAEFQKQFKEFFSNQQQQRPASSVLKDTQDLDRIVHLATQKVLAEYMPQIEQRIRAEVIRQLGQRSLDSSGKN